MCASPGGICHVDYAQLDPELIHVGAINVNTAPLEVLRALPGMTDALAARIIAGRPYGNRDGKRRGIGDLLQGSVLGGSEEEKLDAFRQIAHLLTVRSDVFQIISFGQMLDEDRVRSTQRVETIVQRSPGASEE